MKILDKILNNYYIIYKMSTKEKKINEDETNEENEVFLKGYPKPFELDVTEKIIDQMKNNVCKIFGDTKNGTGFFCKIPFPDDSNLLTVLITNNHVINESILKNKNKKLLISLNNDQDYKEIELRDKKIYTNKDYDITIIEIKKEIDLINNYLEVDKKILTIPNDAYNDETVYMLHYPRSEKVKVSYGIIKSKEESTQYDFKHLCSTESGSSGGPILKITSNSEILVIGVHKVGTKKNYNKGLFLKYPLNDFIKQHSNKKEETQPLKDVLNNNKIIKKEEKYYCYNFLSSSMRRIQKELKDNNKDLPENCGAGPLNDNIYIIGRDIL